MSKWTLESQIGTSLPSCSGWRSGRWHWFEVEKNTRRVELYCLL